MLEEKSAEVSVMERQIPKNVRQIGNVSDTPKIYVEDYVDTFFAQLCDKAGEMPIGAFLVGDIQNTEEEEYVYIYGAIRMHELKLSGTEYVLDEDTWKHAYEDCKQYFEDGEMLGWFVAHSGVPLTPEESTVKLHKKSFPKGNTVFIMKDPEEKDEAYYVHKLDDLMEIGGHYTYYEKNPCMQNYMISARKKNGASPSETVEDRAARDFRSIVRTREEQMMRQRSSRMMYALSTCLVLVVVIMGVATMNNFDKMKSVQNTLETLSGAVSTDSPAKEVEGNGDTSAVGELSDSEKAAQLPDGQTGQSGTPEGDGQAAADQGGTAEGQALASESGMPEGQAASGVIGDMAQEPAVETGGSVIAEGSPEDAGSADISEAGGNSGNGIYIVEQGDTLAIISQKSYGDVSHVDAICRMNGLTDGNLIYIGQKLLLP
jgi:hypothetical protein